MSAIHNIKLELLRPGPAHNQLLSPLTPYIALSGAAGPATVNFPFEHRQLLSRLERLRYATATGEIPIEQREFEARDIGEALGRVLSQVPSLASEISRISCDDHGIIHLRISVSALELAIIPFELAIAPEGLPGSGLPLFLQSTSPITITREVRRGQPPSVNWNRKPRILFAFAQPGNLAPVPAAEHLNALRRAVAPWVKWAATPEEQLVEVKKILTVLPNATIENIQKACQDDEYTHVHILAHGGELGKTEQRFGLALCDTRDPKAMKLVDGETLAQALTGIYKSGERRQPPTLVTLATCDSGQVGSVITPGGSIAHELNAAGIPWVVASQFPLWMRASTIAVDLLYSELLRGEDPRLVLYQLRKRLRTESSTTHDWASIVAYSTPRWDFDEQLKGFRNRQTRSALEVMFDHAHKLMEKDGDDEREGIYDAIRQTLAKWCEEPASPSERAERLGMWAAGEKRIGILIAERKESDPEKVRKAYERSCNLYAQALRANPTNHWVITQHLSMMAVLAAPEEYAELIRRHGNTWTTARSIALWELNGATGGAEVWALATLAELELLGSIYAGRQFRKKESLEEIQRLCQRICESVIDRDNFPIFSTRRQFERYLNDWPRDIWKTLAQVAVDTLTDAESRSGCSR